MVLTLVGAAVKVYLNNKIYPEAQSISLSIDYGETEIRGIDSPYPQEIATTQISVRGSVAAVRIKNSGGLQAKKARPLFTDVLASPYISIRIQDRATGEDILYIPQAKVTKENHSVAAKGRYQHSWEFVGMVPLTAIDRS